MSSFRNRPVLVRVGRVLGTFGVRGHLKFAYTTDIPELLTGRRRFILQEPRTGECLPVQAVEVRLQPDSFVVLFDGFSAPEPLKHFRGWELVHAVRRGELPREPGEAYFFELEGLEVRTPTGEVLGLVEAICESPAHVLLELDCPGRPLIPFTARHVPEVNLAEGWLVTTYPLTGAGGPA